MTPTRNGSLEDGIAASNPPCIEFFLSLALDVTLIPRAGTCQQIPSMQRMAAAQCRISGILVAAFDKARPAIIGP